MIIKKIFFIALFFSLVLAACAPEPNDQNNSAITENPESELTAPVDNSGDEQPTDSEVEQEDPTEEPVPLQGGGTPPRGAEQQFTTDFSIHSVP